MSGQDKRKDVLSYLKQKKYGIYCIQDTHFTEKEEKFIRTQWGYDCILNCFNSQSRGTAIFFNNNFEFKLKNIKKDNNGNKIIISIEMLGKTFTIINIYGPNRDDPNFYEETKREILNFNNDFIIWCGDFNLVLDPDKDTKNYVNINNPRAREKVLDICSELDLIDIWRELNMETERFTWRTNNNNKQGRLDFFLISENLFLNIIDSKIEHGYKSDHSIINITIKGETSTNKKKLFWKFNNSLLKDSKYVAEIKNVINEVKTRYVDNEQAPENIENNDIQFTINDQLFFETLLMEIRGKTIAYASYKKKTSDQRENQLIKEINKLEEKEYLNKNDLLIKKTELEELRKIKLEGLKIRSKAIWVDQGEKPTKYFCALENRNYISKCMPNLIKSDGSKTESEHEIVEETKKYYKNLYSEREVDNINLEECINTNEIPILTNEQNEKLEGNITKTEAATALLHMKNNKSPGSDGFSAEFFKFFWKDIGDFFVRSINFSFNNGQLSITQKEGLITCIPKGDKDKQQLKNWRPISLLNVSYKIASACIANRIKQYLPLLINDDQTGFISGRFIGENTRRLYDLFNFTEENNVPGLLLLIDFEKAFDSLAWSFISKTLTFFNFGESIRKWVSIFYKNINSCVLVNGQASEWFFINRGCRQGDPLSPYIFILCAEILAMLIRQNENIKGVKIGNKEHLISQYADDTSLTLNASEHSLKHTLLVLKFYAKASGLHVNIEKTKVVWFGSMKGSNLEFVKEEKLCWEKGTFNVLGIRFSLDLKEMIKINYDDKIKSIKSLLNQWSKRNLTPYGKITVLKTLALSKINHLLIALPNPNEIVIKELETLFFKFLWNNSPDKIKRTVMIKQYDKGGLKMIDIRGFMHALKLSWLRRLLTEEKTWMDIIETILPNLYNFCNFGIEFTERDIKEIKNSFWKDVFNAWVIFGRKVEIKNWQDFLRQPIWFNPLVKVGGKTVCFKKMVKKNILFISDLVDEKGNFFHYNYIRNTLHININFLDFQGLVQSMQSLKNTKHIMREETNLDKPFCPLPIQILTQDKKGCQSLNYILSSNKQVPTSERKWTTELNLPENFEWQKIYNITQQTTTDTTLKYFQNKIQHRILATNTFLTKIGIKNDKKMYIL